MSMCRSSQGWGQMLIEPIYGQLTRSSALGRVSARVLTLSMLALILASQPVKSASEDDSVSQRSAITVQIINEDQRGSGIILKDNKGRLWITTNQHVVGASSGVCVAFSDGRVLPGRVIQAMVTSYDIAFVRVSNLAKETAYAVPDYQFDPASIVPVVATGYKAETNAYLETSGITVPLLLGRQLESGYSLTYSNQIEKGMSGGGIFSDEDRVIGINALHSDPLWPGDWYDATGTRVRGSLSKVLDAVSVGIPIQSILSVLDRIEVQAAPKSLAMNCNT